MMEQQVAIFTRLYRKWTVIKKQKQWVSVHGSNRESRHGVTNEAIIHGITVAKQYFSGLIIAG